MRWFNGKPGGWAAGLAVAAAGVAALFRSRRPPKKDRPSQQTDATNGSERLAVEQYNRERFTRCRKAAKLVTGWSAFNVAASALAADNTSGAWRYFFELSGFTSALGVVVGVGADYYFDRRDPTDQNPVESLESSERIEKLTLADAGFNASMAALGAYLWRRGVRTESTKLCGYGPALLRQGLVWGGVDAALYALSRRHRRQFELKLTTFAPRLEQRSSARG